MQKVCYTHGILMHICHIHIIHMVYTASFDELASHVKCEKIFWYCTFVLKTVVMYVCMVQRGLGGAPPPDKLMFLRLWSWWLTCIIMQEEEDAE